MKILITGKNGYIGKSLIKKLNPSYTFPNNNYTIIGVGRDDFDLNDREATNKWFKGKYFDVIIHTAISGVNRLKEYDNDILANNLKMFYNLLANKEKFKQLINFGSGTELGKPSESYGLSKNIICEIIKSQHKFNNIRIFGVFDENELDTRFIKSNIKRYKNKEPLIIHQNKLMDFFYMGDLVKLVNYIINNPNIKEINASYFNTYDLLSIANIINNLDSHKCGITLQDKNIGKPYIGGHQEKIEIDFIGLEKAIKKIYEKTN